MGIPGPMYSWDLGQPRTETTAQKIYSHAVSIAGSNPTRAAKFFELADEPAPLWIATDYGSAHGPTGIDSVLDSCAVSGTVPQFVMYSIKGRDGSSFSSGGATSHAAYKAFADSCAAAIAGRRCIWVIEPDAIPKMYAMSGGLNGSEANQRKDAIKHCVQALRAQGSDVKIYLNVGNSNFRSASEIASLIVDCGIEDCDGVSLNVAQTELFDNEHAYFLELQDLEPLVQGYVINTHLNGRGPYVKQTGDRSNVVYINPPIYGSLDGTGGKPNRPTMGVALGPRPTTKMDTTDYPGLHAILWTKFPGGSDGENPEPGQAPEFVSVAAPEPGDLYPDYLEAAYDAAEGLDFSAWEPFDLDAPEAVDPVDVVWTGLDVLMAGDEDRARSAWTAIQVLSPLEERARSSWVGVEALMTGDQDRARASWMAINILFVGEAPELLSEATLAVELQVFEQQQNRALTGLFSEDEQAIPGWLWDRRRLEDSRWNYTQYLSSLGGHTVGLRDGTKKLWWQSGTNVRCAYLDTAYLYIGDRQTWTPQVEIGQYSLQWEPRLLYSDYSVTGKFLLGNVDNDLMTYELHPDAVWTSVQVALWRRDDVFAIRKHFDFKYVEHFTGVLDEDEHTRSNTETEDADIIPANLSTRHKEFRIIDECVVLNGVHTVDNTFVRGADYPDAPPAVNTGDVIEAGGANQEDGVAVLLKYLPIEPGSVRVWVEQTPQVLTEFIEVDDLAYANPDEYVFEVDTDLGIVTTGGFQAPSLVLLDSVNSVSTEITFYPEQNAIEEYPPSGVIIIGSEQIAYSERTDRRFSNCIRGFNSTTAASHSSGDTITHRRMGLGSQGNIFVEYVAIPRVDYEVTQHIVRTANTVRNWLDVKPMSNVETGNIVQIHPGDISLDSVVLETDSPFIGGNLYGPVFYGSDVSRLTATGYDPHGNPVPDIDLTIGIISGSGVLNGSLTQFTDIANTLGEIYADYNHSMIRDEFEFTVTDVIHNGADTVMTVPELIEGTSLDDIWVFQVLKHDKAIGTVGLPLQIVDKGLASQPYGFGYIDLDGVISQDFRDGVVYSKVSGIKYYRTITWLENLRDGDDVLFTRIYVDAGIPGLVNGSTVYLLEPDAIEWQAALLNGSRYILYEFNEAVQHPLTKELGAYYPVHPDSVDFEAKTITFVDRLLPIPQPTVLSNNLGAYVVIAPGQTTLQAWGRDPVTSQLVLSNTIRLRLELPSMFTGVDTSGALPMPIGFNFNFEERNVGTGIGGASFLTLNPYASTAQVAFQFEIDM